MYCIVYIIWIYAQSPVFIYFFYNSTQTVFEFLSSETSSSFHKLTQSTLLQQRVHWVSDCVCMLAQ